MEHDLEELIKQVELIVQQSGDSKNFDAEQWIKIWIQRSVPALGGKRPVDYMNTQEGMVLISNLLAMMKVSSYG